MTSLQERVLQLKKEKDAVILAHYYVPENVQEVADFIGDSYFLAKKAIEVPQQVICFAGVKFMSESAKILNPDKIVIRPTNLADCPMAHMVDIDRIQEMRDRYEDLAVVCYINSTAEIKQYSDVIVTSSNAVKIVKKLPQKNIFFIPDENLGHYVASQVPEKNFIFNKGYCHVHTSITRDNVLRAKEAKPGLKVLAHPECKQEVLELADYIGSTSGIIDYATNCPDDAFLVCTELGVFHELKMKNPGKKFYSVGYRQFCPNMKRITIDRIIKCLEEMGPQVEVDPELARKSNIPLERMLELAK